MPLPHRYPFRWIEPPDSNQPARRRVLVSAAGHGSRLGTLSPFLALEVLAQASAMDASQDGLKNDLQGVTGDNPSPSNGAAPGMLAAINGAEFSIVLQRQPLTAGDVLEVEVEETGRFSRLRKVHGRVFRRGTVVVEADLILHAGG